MSDLETNQAIELIKQGNLVEGAKILSTVLKDQPDNELAWLWMSACVPDREKKIYCLQKVYQINPFNPAAKKGLESFGVQVEPVIPEEMEEPGSMPSVESASFSYRDLTDALGERAPVNKEREPQPPASPVEAAMEETKPAEEATYSFDEIARLEPETFAEAQNSEVVENLDDRLSQSVSIEPPVNSTGEKAMMLEDFGFPAAADLPPAAPVVETTEAAPPVEPVREKIPEPIRRRPRRKTNWLIVIVLILLLVLLALVLLGKYVFYLF